MIVPQLIVSTKAVYWRCEQSYSTCNYVLTFPSGVLHLLQVLFLCFRFQGLMFTTYDIVKSVIKNLSASSYA